MTDEEINGVLQALFQKGRAQVQSSVGRLRGFSEALSKAASVAMRCDGSEVRVTCKDLPELFLHMLFSKRLYGGVFYWTNR